MSTDTLHDKIRSEVERRLAIARDADAGTGTWHRAHNLHRMTAEDGAFIELHSPQDQIRRYEYALKVLDRHKFNGDQPYGAGDECLCIDDWPCVELTDLAESLGIDTGGQP